ncbi:hypothetical protein Trydic_g11697 [Trypoxylus dichotomus]
MDAYLDQPNKYDRFNDFQQLQHSTNGWRPITHSKLHVHRHHKRNNLNQITSTFKQSQPKGLIFVWPQKRKLKYERELVFLTWFLAHGLYWLHVMNLFPNGSGMLLDQPLWKYVPPLPTPQNREYIIEPDWDSVRK